MFEVEGFVFESEELAKKAQKEAEGIKYIKAQTKMNNPDVVFDLYNKVLQKKMFDTPVGMAFLIELQEYLKTIPYIKNEDIRPIPIKKPVVVEKAPKKQVVKKETKSSEYKGRYHFFLYLSGILVLIIVGMFAITYFSGNNINILNYENQIINKYEHWESELNAREAELDVREAELNKGVATDGED